MQSSKQPRIAIISIVPGGPYGEVTHWLRSYNDKSDEHFLTYAYFTGGISRSELQQTIIRVLMANMMLSSQLG